MSVPLKRVLGHFWAEDEGGGMLRWEQEMGVRTLWGGGQLSFHFPEDAGVSHSEVQWEQDKKEGRGLSGTAKI